MSELPFGVARRLAKMPLIAIDPRRSLTTDASKVVIPSAMYGLESGGSAIRNRWREEYCLAALSGSRSPTRGDFEEDYGGDLMDLEVAIITYREIFQYEAEKKER